MATSSHFSSFIFSSQPILFFFLKLETGTHLSTRTRQSKMADKEGDQGSRRPELGSDVDNTIADETRTAEIAANAPRYRRKSSTFIDAIHDVVQEKPGGLAPAQLYSTMSGRLFHSGRISIVMVGLPARGKT